MANPAKVILATLDRHLKAPTPIRLMGGAALILGYELDRATEDADLLIEQSELEALVELGDFGTALEATNHELEPLGLYLSHVWGPEQQILTPEWRQSCRSLPKEPGWNWLAVSVLGPLDLILGKLARADEEDLEDIRHLVAHEALAPAQLRSALDRAMVPPMLSEVFASNRLKVERLLAPR